MKGLRLNSVSYILAESRYPECGFEDARICNKLNIVNNNS